jgi:hypothetical protein
MGKTDSTNEKAATGATEAARQNRPADYHANSAIAQRQRIAAWFQSSNSLTTQQARHELDIMHPAGRIKEMRARGYVILTVWDDYPTVEGNLHRMARYVLMGRNGGGHD